MKDDTSKLLNTLSEKDLQDASTVLTSLVNKCEKAQIKLLKRASQHTLLENRINALRIALKLIEKELLASKTTFKL